MSPASLSGRFLLTKQAAGSNSPASLQRCVETTSQFLPKLIKMEGDNESSLALHAFRKFQKQQFVYVKAVFEPGSISR